MSPEFPSPLSTTADLYATLETGLFFPFDSVATNVDGNVRGAAELLLQLRFGDYTRALSACEVSVEREGGDSFARGALWSAFQDAFRAHCRRALEDYVSLLALFDALASSEELERGYGAHVDRMSQELLKRLGTGARADRNRVSNLVSALKAEAQEALSEEASRQSRGRLPESSESSDGGELDDRLPLGRRGAFDRDLVEAVEISRRQKRPLALVMMDIDHFKKVNDAHGHPVGDEVLLAVAGLVVERTAHKGRAYRYGGEEVALLLPTYSAEEASGLAERIRRDLEGRALSSKDLRVTASFGVASIPDQASDAKALLERADSALYQAKESGRNRVQTAPDNP